MLDIYGKLAAAEIAFYFPLWIFTTIMVIRHGLRRDAGWIFLWVFSMVRIADGALFVAAEEMKTVNKGVYEAAYILQAVGLGPLLLATIGFLGLVGQHAYSEHNGMRRTFRIEAFIVTIALVLVIVGGVELNAGKSVGTTLRKAGYIVYAAAYVLIAITIFGAWGYKHVIMRYRKGLLFGVTCAIPFLGVRVAYGVLNAFSSEPGLAKFNDISGDWVLYLVMSLVMEFCVVLIYCIAGASIPLSRDMGGHEY